MMAGFHSFQTTLSTTPGHHRSIRSQTTVQNLVPAQQVTAVAVQETFHAVNQVTLQFVHVLQPFFLHAGLAERTGLPRCLSSLITTYMNIFGRKQIHHFQQDILKELECFLVPDTEIRLFIRLMRTRKFRISGQYLFRVGRHLDFRNQRDVMLLRVGHQFANVILGIVTAFCLRIVFLTILAITVPPVLPYRLRTPSSKLCQSWILLDFDTPSCRIRQMQVQTVNFVIRKNVHLFLYEFLVEKMTRNIQHHSTIRETRFILDTKGRNLCTILSFQL